MSPSLANFAALTQVGRRVSIRRVVGAGAGRPVFTDAIGWLEAIGSDELLLRHRDGTATLIDPRSVVAAKLVPPPALSMGERSRAAAALAVPIPELARISALGWPGLDNGQIGAWLLRAGAGFTGRANAALPVGDPGMSIGEAIDAVVAWYTERDLPPRVQVPLPYADAVDEALAARGWIAGDGAHVLVADVSSLLALPQRTEAVVRLDSAPDDAWISGYHYRGGHLPPAALAVLKAGRTLVFGSIRDESGSVWAIARGALDEGWLGVTAVEVAENARRRGLAGAVLRGLVEWGAKRGAVSVSLQVATNNVPALAMYRAAGFTNHHWYHYRHPARGDPHSR